MGATLSSVLMEHHGRLAQNRVPDLTVTQILKWADHYYMFHGRWPSERLGMVSGAFRGDLACYQSTPKTGGGVCPGASLARLLKEHRHSGKTPTFPDFDIAQILSWADAHHAVCWQLAHEPFRARKRTHSGIVEGD